MSDQFPSRSEVLAKHLRYHDRPDRGEWRVFCSCESRKWFTEAIEVISDETYIAHVEQVWREACKVTTVEQLDALPDRTVILDSDDTVLRRNPWHSESPVKWYPFDGDEAYERDFGITADAIEFPARVIHNPDWETK